MAARGLTPSLVILLMTLPAPAAEPDQPAGPLQAKLKARLVGQGGPGKDGRLPLELAFSSDSDKEQKFAVADYRFSVLNKDGEQLADALTLSLETREVVLKGKPVTDKPGVFVQKDKLKAGEEYYLVVSVRNLVGLVRFTAE